MDDLDVEEQRLQQAFTNFKTESKTLEKQLKSKLAAAQNQMRKQKEEEMAFERRQADFDDVKAQVMRESDTLQEELERYCTEKN